MANFSEDYDPHLIECSVILRPSVELSLRENFSSALKSIIHLKDIVAFANSGKGEWILTLRTPDLANKVAAKGELRTSNGVLIKAWPCSMSTASLRVYRLPPIMFQKTVDKYFVNLGLTVVAHNEELSVSPSYEHVKTGVRRLVVKGSPADLGKIGNLVKISDKEALIVVQGRPSFCTKCKLTGHISRLCTTPWCGDCRSHGHTAKSSDCLRYVPSSPPADLIRLEDFIPESVISESVLPPVSSSDHEDKGSEQEEGVMEVNTQEDIIDGDLSESSPSSAWTPEREQDLVDACNIARSNVASASSEQFPPLRPPMSQPIRGRSQKPGSDRGRLKHLANNSSTSASLPVRGSKSRSRSPVKDSPNTSLSRGNRFSDSDRVALASLSRGNQSRDRDSKESPVT